MSREHELKYAVQDLEALEAWLDRELPPERGAAGSFGWREVVVSDRYFDTADGALAAAGYGARLRQTSDGMIVSVKEHGRSSGAVHSRRELEAVATSSLVPEDWPPSGVRDLVRRIAGGRPLVERFRLDQRRRERRLAMDATTMTISLDSVVVSAGGATHGPLNGLEVELLSGRPDALEAIARRVEASGLAMPEPRTKMEIAAHLTGC